MRCSCPPSGIADKSKAYLLEPLEKLESQYEKKDKKKAAAFGWDVFNQKSLYNSYKKRTANVTVDMEEYEAAKAADPEFYRDGDSMLYGQAPKVSEAALDRMVGELTDRSKKRKEFSRRRTVYESRDVDSINDRNAHFNKKLERSYGKFTTEIKQNLERGTGERSDAPALVHPRVMRCAPSFPPDRATCRGMPQFMASSAHWLACPCAPRVSQRFRTTKRRWCGVRGAGRCEAAGCDTRLVLRRQRRLAAAVCMVAGVGIEDEVGWNVGQENCWQPDRQQQEGFFWRGGGAAASVCVQRQHATANDIKRRSYRMRRLVFI